MRTFLSRGKDIKDRLYVTSRRKFPPHLPLRCLIDSVQLKPGEESSWSRLFKSKSGELWPLWWPLQVLSGVSLDMRPHWSWRGARLQLHSLKEEKKQNKTPTLATSSPREGTSERLQTTVSVTWASERMCGPQGPKRTGHWVGHRQGRRRHFSPVWVQAWKSIIARVLFKRLCFESATFWRDWTVTWFAQPAFITSSPDASAGGCGWR